MEAPKSPEIIPNNIENIEVPQASKSPEVPSVDAQPSNIAGVNADDTKATLGPDIEALKNIDDALDLKPRTQATASGELTVFEETEKGALGLLNKN